MKTIDKNTHYHFLNDSYNEVGKKTWMHDDFMESSLESSKRLFTANSLEARNPVPKELEVYALLSGLSFEKSFSNKLVEIQNEIDEILDGSLRYWVIEENFGLEYCVFKWPECNWSSEKENEVYSSLPMIGKSFTFEILGIQINPDGCVIAKGFDEGAKIFSLRKKIREKISFLPERQSGWAHIPLGRILEPLGTEKFSELSSLCKSLSNKFIVSCEINSIKFVREEQWYMENKFFLKEFELDKNS